MMILMNNNNNNNINNNNNNNIIIVIIIIIIIYYYFTSNFVCHRNHSIEKFKGQFRQIIVSFVCICKDVLLPMFAFSSIKFDQ